MIVYNKFIGLALFFLCLTNSYGQDQSSILAQIKQTFQKINNDKKYEIIIIDNSDAFLGHSTDNGGSLKGFYQGDSLLKIVEWVGLSNRVVQTEYYFDKGKLVFVYSTDSIYKFNHISEKLDYSKFDEISEERYYFNNDKLIAVLLSEKEKNKQQDATDFLTSSEYYTKLLNTKRYNKNKTPL